jgi:toxin-antitoxin system PIN domain toxin
MILADANLLLHAYDEASPHHAGARSWLERSLSTGQLFELSWQTVTAFIRIITNPRAFSNPMTIEEAVGVIGDLLAHPAVVILAPGERHWMVFRGYLVEGQAFGPLAMDAHLAALAVEHGAVLCTTDRDFTRFAGLKMLDPLKQKSAD